MRIFAADDGFLRAGVRAVRERSAWRDAGLVFGREPAELRRLDVVPRGALAERVPGTALDLLRERGEAVAAFPLRCRGVDLPVERSAVCGPSRFALRWGSAVPAGFFETRRPASGFCCVAARFEGRGVAARSLAGTSVMSTSPSSDTGRSGTRLPSSSNPSSASGAS